MSTQHTPGPWELNLETEKVSGFDESGERRVVVYELGTNEADARLIASAPDLLKALEQISDYARKDGDMIAQHLAGIARAAIAKATGGAK